MFFVRAAAMADLPGLAEAARHLDSVNLPHDRDKLRVAITKSEAAFAAVAASGGQAPTDPPGEFLFVMVERDDAGRERAVGSSMIFAQHGSRRAPHSFFDVIEDERYSETLDRHFRHKLLRIGYNYEGMTELGGLVLLPELRGHAEKLGKSLVFVRFLYIALFRAVFRPELVSELMPPLEPDGTSRLWEAVGRHFTGLSYQEADRLSRENKEFIRALFPQDPIYASLLPGEAQALIGVVGPRTKAVERMLTEAGFRYAERIDPFDGGPHFHARTDELVPIKRARRLHVQIDDRVSADAVGLVAASAARAPWFRAVRSPARAEGDTLVVPAATAAALESAAGDEVGWLPL
jgi:arginine N-succinyltransferase